MDSNIVTLASALMGAIVGGVISYISTSKLEERKEKREFELKRIELVLIPLCGHLEETIIDIKSKKYIEIEFDEWFERLKRLARYTKANNRFLLSQKFKDPLVEYLKLLSELNELLEKECDKVLSEYRRYLGNKLEKFISCETSSISISSNTENIIKKAILNNESFGLSREIKSVAFTYYEEFLERCDRDEIHLTKESWDIYQAIPFGITGKEDLDEDVYNLLEFLSENVIPFDEIETARIIDQTSSSKKLDKILILLDQIRDEIYKTIDKTFIQ